MQMMAESVGLAARSARGTINETMPDPVRRPPGHPPREPIIIKISRLLPEAPEINRSDDEEGASGAIRSTNAFGRDYPLTRRRLGGSAQPDRLAEHVVTRAA
jgi:hypothetical protein